MNNELPTSAIDDVITYMTVPGVHRDFAGAILFFEPFLSYGRDSLAFFDEAADPNIAGQLDVRTVQKGDPKDGMAYLMQRFYARGRAMNRSLKLPEHWQLVSAARTFIDNNGKIGDCSHELWAYTKNRGYFQVRHNGRSTSTDLSGGRTMSGIDLVEHRSHRSHEILHNTTNSARRAKGIRLVGSIQLSYHYEWMVRLGYEGCASVSIPTDPTGIFELFKLRDLEPGKIRRSPLVHWVKEHLRQRRDDPSKTAKVREHIRGQTDFNWSGFCVRVTPPKFDLERLADKGNEKAAQLLVGK